MARAKRKKAIPLQNDELQETINRIGECETVINEIDNSGLWRIVIKDMEEQRRMLDDNWQEIIDSEKLQKARELKFATMHILTLKSKYEEELKVRKRELEQSQNIENEVIKDYDTETITGG